MKTDILSNLRSVFIFIMLLLAMLLDNTGHPILASITIGLGFIFAFFYAIVIIIKSENDK